MSKTILIAEDDVVIRNGLLRTLTGENYEVLEAGSEDEALKLSRSCDGVIDLIVTDCFLRTVRARELWQTLQSSRPDLKVLQISGYTLAKMQTEQYLIAGAEFLRKPFGPRVLTKTVRRIIGRAEAIGHLAFSA